jgi:hypothetical protein
MHSCHSVVSFNIIKVVKIKFNIKSDKWVPVTTAWLVLRLRMEKRPPDMESSCEYFE